MFLRYITANENNVGTWAREHGFYFPKRSLTHYTLHIF